MGKIRRVDYFPDEFLVGTTSLSLEETGAYWKVCSLIYSRGGPIDDDNRWIASAIAADVRQWKRIRSSLLSKGKLRIVDGRLTNTRCEAELSKTHQRIEDAQRNGALGGRPPKSFHRGPAADVAEISPFPAGATGVASGHPDEISAPELLAANGLEKPNGLLHGKTNQQPPTTNDQEDAAPSKDKIYAFTGRVIHLTAADFTKWQAEVADTIPDLMAQLADDDAYYDRTMKPEDRKKWFHRLHRKLLNQHQRVLSERAKDRRPDLSESF